jgi:hypothetical protein
VAADDYHDRECGISCALRSDYRLYVGVHDARQPFDDAVVDEPATSDLCGRVQIALVLADHGLRLQVPLLVGLVVDPLVQGEGDS